MCDTVVALPAATADGVTLFAKNSDREPNEAQIVVQVPAADHAPGSMVRCTYVEIPQAAHTHAVLLSRPFWMWGAEMGANEHGVVIGNEAVFTKVPYEKDGGLTGMDLLRLGLERAATARTALDVIVELLAAHGQGGNCGFDHELYYHNSFIIADAAEAWVLETAGPHWAAERVRGVRSISNGLTIGSEWDLASPDLVAYAVERGWCNGRDDFDFARCYSDFTYTTFGQARARQQCTTGLLRRSEGGLTVETMAGILRDHGPAQPDPAPGWTPARGIAVRQTCQHAGWGPIRGDQTTGSLISHVTPDGATHFVTGTAAPCTSVFKPVWADGPHPDTGPAPTGTYDPDSLFWRHEALHRATLHNYAARLPLYAAERDALEADFVRGALACADAPPEERAAFSAECFAQAAEAEQAWLARVLADDSAARRGPLYAAAWRGFNRKARIRPAIENA